MYCMSESEMCCGGGDGGRRVKTYTRLKGMRGSGSSLMYSFNNPHTVWMLAALFKVTSSPSSIACL